MQSMIRLRAVTVLLLIIGFTWVGMVYAEEDFINVDKMPEMLEYVEPEYPELLKKAGIEGTVYIKAFIDKDGNVGDVKIAKSSGHEEMDRAAATAAVKAKFRPAIKDGKPVAVWVTYSVNFVLGSKSDCKSK